MQCGHFPPVLISKLVLQNVHNAFTGLVSTAEEEVVIGGPAGPEKGFEASIINSWGHFVFTLIFFLVFTLLLTHFVEL